MTTHSKLLTLSGSALWNGERVRIIGRKGDGRIRIVRPGIGPRLVQPETLSPLEQEERT